MKLLALLLLCVPARATTLSTLDVLRGIAADQGSVQTDLPTPPSAKPAPTTQFEGTGKILPGSRLWARPGAALKDRSFQADDDKNPLWLTDDPASRALPVGLRAYLKGTVQRGTLRVDDATVFPAKNLVAKADNSLFSVELAQVSAWCDHMPTFGKPDHRQHLVVSTVVSNKTDQPVEVKLARVFLSFKKGSEGSPVSGLSVRADNGRPSGETKIALAPHETKKLDLRGDGLYGEGAHDKTLYVTLSLSSSNKTLFVRGEGDVLMTQ